MFDFLKKKISGFVEKLTGREEAKAEVRDAVIRAPPEPSVQKEAAEILEEERKPVPKAEPAREKTKSEPKAEIPKPKTEARPETRKEAKPEPPKPKPEARKAEPEAPKPAPAPSSPPWIPEKKEEPLAALLRKEEKKEEAKKPEPKKEIPKPQPEPAKKETPVQKPAPAIKEIPKAPPAEAEIQKPKPAPEPKAIPKTEIPKTEPETQKREPAKKEIQKPEPKVIAPAPEPAIKEIQKPEPRKPEPARAVKQKPKEPAPQPPASRAPSPGMPAPSPEPSRAIPEPQKERQQGVRLGVLKQVSSFITREVEIGEKDVAGLLDSLELELLESDVEIGVAGQIRGELAGRLVGAKVPRGGLDPFVKKAVRDTLVDAMSAGEPFGIPQRVKDGAKPVKIMFLGPNGSGKTTTIAKVAKMLIGGGHTVVFAAADTFRAAAIEQMSVHADRLGVKIIKREYGSDPTSVAYDAANYAKAHGVDAVLIDTAGRQDTNVNLLNELKKMDRVIAPDMKIYIGESIAGSAIMEQVSSFHREIGLHGVILTKLDCDPKGGVVLSISRATGLPILYIGTGQGYDDLEPFDAAAIVDRIVS